MALFLWILLVAAQPNYSQLSPGQLSAPHAQLEGLSKCTVCHEAGKRVSTEKCLVCHTEISTQLQSETGLHGRENSRACQICHSEHHGREFDLVHFKEGREHFDHARTGWPLEGRHKTMDCRACHRPELIRNPQEMLNHGKDLTRTFL